MSATSCVACSPRLRRRPPELVVFVTANLDAEAIEALRACRPRSAVLVVCTGGDAATADLRIVDARVESFPDAWRAANTRTRATAVAHDEQPVMDIRRTFAATCALAALSAAVATGSASGHLGRRVGRAGPRRRPRAARDRAR